MPTKNASEVKLRWRIKQLKREKEARDGRDYTWKEIAEEANLDYGTVLNVANDKTDRADLDTILKLADYFNVGIDELFERTPA